MRISVPLRLWTGGLLLAGCSFRDPAELGQDFLLTEDQVLLVIELDLVASVFAEQNPVTHLHIERNSLTLLDLAGSDGHHFAFLRLLFSRIRDDDAAFRSL